MNKWIPFFSIMLSMAVPAKAQQILPVNNYLTLRSGLPHLSYEISEKKACTVAFLGGSITFNPGWRDKISIYLKERFPDTRFHFIVAGIPSLGSLPHAFRLQRDVLDSGKVDLLFIEAAVNDHANNTDSITQIRSLEGIVRHARRDNPLMDIIMMSFSDPDKNASYALGKVPAEVANHELIAEHYQLPSVNLAKEVHDKIKNKEFDWKKDFKDLHPSPFGQELYFASIKELLGLTLVPNHTDRVREPLPSPLDSANFDAGSYVDIREAKTDSDWHIDADWVPVDSLATRPGFVHVPVLSALKPGAALSLKFNGTAIGITVLSGQDAGIVSYSIDNSPYKEIDLYTPWSKQLHLPWYILFAGNLKAGAHLLKIKVANIHNPLSKANACRIVYFFKNQ